MDITHGFSKDKRPDLKQFQVGLGVNRDGVPLVGDILDGNASDSDWNRQFIEEVTNLIDESTRYGSPSEALPCRDCHRLTAHAFNGHDDVPHKVAPV